MFFIDLSTRSTTFVFLTLQIRDRSKKILIILLATPNHQSLKIRNNHMIEVYDANLAE